MDLFENWKDIKEHFRNSFISNLHVSIASVNDNNDPTNTPIGSFFLNDNQTGFYFEKYPTNLPANAHTHKKICVLGVNSSKWFWLKSLFKEEFSSHPAIKLYGELGEKRKATETELRALKRRLRLTEGLKGYKYLWRDMEGVREIKFTKAEKINLGKMTQKL